MLRELTSLLRASLELAEASRAAPGSEVSTRALESARRRVERARNAPAEAASSDLREALRVLERSVQTLGGGSSQA